MKPFLGICLFLVLLIVSTFWVHPRYQATIERDLKMKVAAVLSQHGLDSSGIVIKNHHLTHLGKLPAGVAERKALQDDLDGIIGLYADIDLSGPAPLPPSPPSFRLAEQADQSVILSGTVRDEAERSYLVNLASTPVKSGGSPRSVIDQLKLSDEVAAIQPTDKLSSLAPQILTNATEGCLSWTPSDATMGGLLENMKQEAALLNLASATLPAEVAPVTNFKIQPYQNLEFGIVRGSEEIVVTGLLPDVTTQTRLLNLVKSEAKGARVVDDTSIALRPRAGWWMESVEGTIPSFLAATDGPAKLHYSHDRFAAEATFRDEKGHESMREIVHQIPASVERVASFSLGAQPAPLLVKPSPDAPIMSAMSEDESALAAAMIKRLKPLAIYFNTSSSRIKSSQNKQINAAAAIILGAKTVTQTLTVGGYADLRGNAASNRALSLKRANAVRSGLIKKGVPAERLIVAHFGEDTSQTSRKNLWKSRRVEISITEKSEEVPTPSE